MKNNLLLLFLFAPFFLSAQKNADCDAASYICHKSLFEFTACAGEGKKHNETGFVDCFMTAESAGYPEKNSTWMKWQVKEAGTLSFVIAPKDSLDDFDFVVFRLNDKGQCKKKGQAVRCMAAGNDNPCLGKTGLWPTETDTNEDAGCADAGDNNFLAPLEVKPGEWYTLLVCNMTSANGFFIRFEGTAELGCEE